jgi:hypothetical protein
MQYAEHRRQKVTGYFFVAHLRILLSFFCESLVARCISIIFSILTNTPLFWFVCSLRQQAELLLTPGWPLEDWTIELQRIPAPLVGRCSLADYY